MADLVAPIRVLSTRLCPWLMPHLARLEGAREEGRLAHGWLLAGPAGIGKINLALVMAERLLDPSSAPPATLDRADATAAWEMRHQPTDHHPDLHWAFPKEDKRTISVEQIRDLGGQLELKSLSGGAKVVIIEPAEAMTLEAANALLKTLEEPTSDTYLLLVSHQPGRLPATIRSRCQVLTIARPTSEEALAWLGADNTAKAADWAGLLTLAEGAPILAAGLNHGHFNNLNNKLNDNFNLLSKMKADPHDVVEQCFKTDPALALGWLAARLQAAIRARLAAEGSNPITDLDSETLHNAWALLTLKDLFDQLDATERVRGQLGGGINTDLALRVLLLGFQPERGQS